MPFRKVWILVRICSVLVHSRLAHLEKCPSLAFEEVSHALAVLGLPTRPQCPPAFFSPLFSFFVPFPSFPQRNFAAGIALETTIANSVDPLHPRFCPSSCVFPFPKVDR
jgi:hypothetical protein